MNWPGEGMLSNRDAGVVIENATAAAYFDKIFLDNWDHHAKNNGTGPEIQRPSVMLVTVRCEDGKQLGLGLRLTQCAHSGFWAPSRWHTVQPTCRRQNSCKISAVFEIKKESPVEYLWLQ
jgi:hypothetical protein